ncbi:MAG: hypothetical protein ACRCX4_02195 [Bacteroidales bacterium]
MLLSVSNQVYTPTVSVLIRVLIGARSADSFEVNQHTYAPVNHLFNPKVLIVSIQNSKLCV